MSASPSYKHPEYQPVVDFIVKAMRERGLSMTSFAALIYGRDENGKVRGSAQVSQLLNGYFLPARVTIDRWRKAGIDLGPAVEDAKVLRQQLKEARAPARPVRDRRALTPVRAAVAAYEQAAKEPKPAQLHESRRVGPPLFALSIDQEGKSNITLNLMDISSKEALRAIAVLTAANLIVARK